MLFKKRKLTEKPTPGFEAFTNSYVAKAQEVIWHNVDGRGVILNTKTASYYTLDGVALRVWELIEEGISGLALAEAIYSEYEKNLDLIKNDLAEIFDSMKEEGIIEIRVEENKK